MIGAPAALRARNLEPHAALIGELEGVGQQILQHLLQPLGVGDHALAQLRIDLDVEGKMPVLGFVPERPGGNLEQFGKNDLLDLQGNRAGLDLR
jgi:hypothetical protein